MRFSVAAGRVAAGRELAQLLARLLRLLLLLLRRRRRPTSDLPLQRPARSRLRLPSGWQAPEVIGGFSATEKGDVWSFGVVLHEVRELIWFQLN